jgi:metallo-beta-lactamase family protein
MTSSITFWGAAGQVTGSCHLLEWHGRKVALDCGMFQGRRDESRRLNASLPMVPKQLDAVVLSHAHIDHSGRLPLLAANQFDGPIHATPATRDLCAPMLADAAHIQESDFRWLTKKGRVGPEAAPLYTIPDAVKVQQLMHAHPYGKSFLVGPGDLRATFHDAGHILGSASIELTGGANDPRIVFSGDIGRWGQPIIRDPAAPRGPVDVLIIESTYARKSHETPSQATVHLGDVIRRVAARGGKLLIPSFALGRTQELVYAIHELFRSNAIPEIPIYIDSPLALRATDVFRMHPEIMDQSEDLVRNQSAKLLDHRLVRYVRDVNESKALNGLKGAAVIIAASGMAESGRILHHLLNHSENPDNCILFVGFQGQGTLGRRLQDGQKNVRILGEERTIAAETAVIDGYSAHADRDELRRWVRDLGGPVKRAYCVHGEPEALIAMKALLEEEGVKEVHVPKHGEKIEI